MGSADLGQEHSSVRVWQGISLSQSRGQRPDNNGLFRWLVKPKTNQDVWSWRWTYLLVWILDRRVYLRQPAQTDLFTITAFSYNLIRGLLNDLTWESTHARALTGEKVSSLRVTYLQLLEVSTSFSWRKSVSKHWLISSKGNYNIVYSVVEPTTLSETFSLSETFFLSETDCCPSRVRLSSRITYVSPCTGLYLFARGYKTNHNIKIYKSWYKFLYRFSVMLRPIDVYTEDAGDK